MACFIIIVIIVLGIIATPIAVVMARNGGYNQGGTVQPTW